MTLILCVIALPIAVLWALMDSPSVSGKGRNRRRRR